MKLSLIKIIAGDWVKQIWSVTTTAISQKHFTMWCVWICLSTRIHWLDRWILRKQLDIMPTYHYVENQGKPFFFIFFLFLFFSPLIYNHITSSQLYYKYLQHLGMPNQQKQLNLIWEILPEKRWTRTLC